MDFNMKFEDVDNVIDAIKFGIQKLEEALDKLKATNGNFNEGGFQGQSADKMIEVLNQKMKHLKDLMDVYTKTMESLRQAQIRAIQADEMLQSRIKAI